MTDQPTLGSLLRELVDSLDGVDHPQIKALVREGRSLARDHDAWEREERARLAALPKLDNEAQARIEARIAARRDRTKGVRR